MVALVGWFASWRALDRRYDSSWLLRLYGFTWLQAHGQLPELRARLDTWAEAVAAQIAQTPADEVLIVGHSTGSMLAVELAARLRAGAAQDETFPGGSIALLTLGHCVPILASFPAAQGFRQAIAEVADWSGLTWHDVSAPRDWAAFARTPPWQGCAGRARLAQYSPRFHRTLDAAAYQALVRDQAALHLQYLRAPRVAGGYDPVVWMAGPLRLSERHRTPSRPGGRLS